MLPVVSSITPALVPLMLERVKRLHLLSFNKEEIKPIIEAEYGVSITHADFNLLYEAMREELATMPEVKAIKRKLGESWSRMDMLKTDLLTIYQTMLRNYNAWIAGKTEHDDEDGGPVIAVKPSDIAQMAERIAKFDQDTVVSQLNALKVLPQFELPPVEESTPKSLEDELVEDDTLEGDFTEA